MSWVFGRLPWNLLCMIGIRCGYSRHRFCDSFLSLQSYVSLSLCVYCKSICTPSMITKSVVLAVTWLKKAVSLLKFKIMKVERNNWFSESFLVSDIHTETVIGSKARFSRLICLYDNSVSGREADDGEVAADGESQSHWGREEIEGSSEKRWRSTETHVTTGDSQGR